MSSIGPRTLSKVFDLSDRQLCLCLDLTFNDFTICYRLGIDCVLLLPRLRLGLVVIVCVLLGSDLYIVRLTQTGLAASKPCQGCLETLREFGVKNIYYSTRDGIEVASAPLPVLLCVLLFDHLFLGRSRG